MSASPPYAVPRRRQHIDAPGAGLLLFCSVLMGLNQVVIKLTNAGLAPVFQAGMRSLLALGPVFLIALVLRRRLSFSDGSLVPGMIAGLFFAMEFLLLFQALDHTTVARASVFFYTMPFWAALGAHHLIPGERMSATKLAGLALAIVGIVVALWDQLAAGGETLRGDLYCLVGAVFWAGIILVARTTRLSNACPEMQLLYQLAVSGPVLLLAAWLIGDPVREFTAFTGWLMGFQVLVVVCLGFLTWFWVLSIYPAADMAAFSFLSPVFGVIFGWMILGETLTGNVILALVLVSAGVWLVSRRR
jgi:drug/metabolite transporter (DMT)-like permease